MSGVSRPLPLSSVLRANRALCLRRRPIASLRCYTNFSGSSINKWIAYTSVTSISTPMRVCLLPTTSFHWERRTYSRRPVEVMRRLEALKRDLVMRNWEDVEALLAKLGAEHEKLSFSATEYSDLLSLCVAPDSIPRVRQGAWRVAQALMQQLQREGIRPTDPMLLHFVKAYENSATDLVLDVFGMLSTQCGIQRPSRNIFHHMIVRAKRIDKTADTAFALWERMKKIESEGTSSSPSSFAYHESILAVLLRTATKFKDMARMEQLLAVMQERNMPISKEDYIPIIALYAAHDKKDNVLSLLDHMMKSNDPKMINDAWNIYLQLTMEGGQFEAVKQALETMENAGARVNHATCSRLVSIYAKNRLPKEGLQMLLSMKDRMRAQAEVKLEEEPQHENRLSAIKSIFAPQKTVNDEEPYDLSSMLHNQLAIYRAAAMQLLLAFVPTKDWDSAVQTIFTLTEMNIPLDIGLFGVLFKFCEGQLDKVEWIMERIEAERFNPDLLTIHAALCACGDNLELALKVWNNFVNARNKTPDVKILTVLMSIYIRNEQYEEAKQLAERYSPVVKLDLKAFGLLMSSCITKKMYKQAWELYEASQTLKIKADDRLFAAALLAAQRIFDFDNLIQEFGKMQATQGMLPTPITLTPLFRACQKEEDLRAVLQVLYRAHEAPSEHPLTYLDREAWNQLRFAFERAGRLRLFQQHTDRYAHRTNLAQFLKAMKRA
ncbi:hypothetical protein QOT17_002435 [Balamuthia mandrillaris]